MDSYILSHDLGTTGDKATLFSSSGDLVASSFSPYPTYYPNPGWAEQNPDYYWRAFCDCTNKLLEKSGILPSRVAVVSFSGQMMGALPVDGQGNGLRNSIIWADMRSTAEVENLSKEMGEEQFYKISGNRLSANYPVAKIMWLKNNEPNVYKKTCKFINAKDFVAAQLTGNILSDYSDASAMALLDITSQNWSDEILKASGIDRDKLPDLVESTDGVGKVRKDASKKSGLLEGTPVVKGAGDGPCATAGSGVVKEGEAYMYIGTSTWMGLATEKPLIDSKMRTHTFCHFKRGLYAPAGTMQAGGGSLSWLKSNLCASEIADARRSGVDVYDILSGKAGKVPAGAGGLIFLPYLMGERCPYWNPDLRGCFIGLSITHTKQHIIRSVLEGVAYHMRLIAEVFIEQGATFSSIRIIGGGAKSELWRKIFSDVMSREIALLNFTEEATSIGAAIAGGIGIGLFSSMGDADKFVKVVERTIPDNHNRQLYGEHYKLFKSSYDCLVEIFPMLSPDVK